MLENFLEYFKNTIIFVLFSYSRVVVKWNNYWNNPSDNFFINWILNIVFFLKKNYYKTIYNSLIEPKYPEWIQICKLSDDVYHEHYYDISDCDNNHIIDSFEELGNDINKTQITECLVIIKNKTKNYLTRIIYPEIHTNKKHKPFTIWKKDKIIKPLNLILDIEYLHPKMKEPITFELNRGFYIENNQLFSPLFIKRCLEYQNKPYYFDMEYSLKIMDMKLKMIELDSSQYIHILENNEYEICKII